MNMSVRPTFQEHGAEPIPGLPGALPSNEAILWQGSPRWTGIAERALHLRWLVTYFALLAIWRGGAHALDGATAMEALGAAFLILPVGAVPLGLLAGFAWLSARSTVYTVTSRRVVIRTGVALPLTVNIPYTVIGSAALARHDDGTGDVAIRLMPPHRVSWIALWPHTKSWRFTRPEPTLRAVAEPELVARILGSALSNAAAAPVQPRRVSEDREIGEAPAGVLA